MAVVHRSCHVCPTMRVQFCRFPAENAWGLPGFQTHFCRIRHFGRKVNSDVKTNLSSVSPLRGLYMSRAVVRMACLENYAESVGFQ